VDTATATQELKAILPLCDTVEKSKTMPCQRKTDRSRMSNAALNEERTTVVREYYNRIAPLYNVLEVLLERRYYAAWRTGLFARVRGPQVLDIGVGTGKNLAYYPAGTNVTAIDLSPGMLAHAREKAAGQDACVHLNQMDAQHLAFPDDTFDTTVATFVFGSVPDPVRGLREAARVTKPDGQILLLEYVRPPGVLGVAINLLNPLVFRLYGANINRRTMQNAERAELTVISIERFWRGMVVLIVAQSGTGRRPRSATAAR